jgi:hypothetical protein
MKTFTQIITEELALDNSMSSKIIPNEKVYQLVQKIHRNYDDFIDGDLGDRLDKYDYYELKYIDIDNINLEEWEVQDYLVDDIEDEMKNNNDYPPIVVSHKMSIIDGIHRANALNNLGYKTIKAYVGIRKK